MKLIAVFCILCLFVTLSLTSPQRDTTMRLMAPNDFDEVVEMGHDDANVGYIWYKNNEDGGLNGEGDPSTFERTIEFVRCSNLEESVMKFNQEVVVGVAQTSDVPGTLSFVEPEDIDGAEDIRINLQDRGRESVSEFKPRTSIIEEYTHVGQVDITGDLVSKIGQFLENDGLCLGSLEYKTYAYNPDTQVFAITYSNKDRSSGSVVAFCQFIPETASCEYIESHNLVLTTDLYARENNPDDGTGPIDVVYHNGNFVFGGIFTPLNYVGLNIVYGALFVCNPGDDCQANLYDEFLYYNIIRGNFSLYIDYGNEGRASELHITPIDSIHYIAEVSFPGTGVTNRQLIFFEYDPNSDRYITLEDFSFADIWDETDDLSNEAPYNAFAVTCCGSLRDLGGAYTFIPDDDVYDYYPDSDGRYYTAHIVTNTEFHDDDNYSISLNYYDIDIEDNVLTSNITSNIVTTEIGRGYLGNTEQEGLAHLFFEGALLGDGNFGFAVASMYTFDKGQSFYDSETDSNNEMFSVQYFHCEDRACLSFTRIEIVNSLKLAAGGLFGSFISMDMPGALNFNVNPNSGYPVITFATEHGSPILFYCMNYECTAASVSFTSDYLSGHFGEVATWVGTNQTCVWSRSAFSLRNSEPFYQCFYNNMASPTGTQPVACNSGTAGEFYNAEGKIFVCTKLPDNRDGETTLYVWSPLGGKLRSAVNEFSQPCRGPDCQWTDCPTKNSNLGIN